jgi:hypothetical protein
MNTLNELIDTCLNEKYHSLTTTELIKNLIHSNIRVFLKDSCFYYSAGADHSPIVSCLDLTKHFIYCDKHGKKNNNEKLFTLKSRLQEHSYTELGYCSLPAQWFNLYDEKYYGSYGLRCPYPTNLLKADFSLWKSKQSYFVLIYINFDNNAIWHNIFVKNKIAPKLICNYCHEDGVDFNKAKFDNDMLPDFWLGHTHGLKDFIFQSRIPYLGMGRTEREKIDLYQRKKYQEFNKQF